jgi:membrane protease YdiL (CAAX protease family)
MRCSRWSVWGIVGLLTLLGTLLAVGAGHSTWLINAVGFTLAKQDCTDPTVYFKLLLWGPVVEEWVFRAGLQNFLTRKLGKALWANGLVSLLFGLLHFVLWPHAAAWLVVLPSLALGWVYARSQSLNWTIALHVGFNFVFMAWSCGSYWA